MFILRFYCFNYKEISDCIICKSHNEIIKYNNPLISIDNEEILYDRLEDIIYKKFSISHSLCEFCSYTPEKIIKTGNIYRKCLNKNYIDIKYPYIISFCFEKVILLTDINDDYQFSNLIKYRDYIIKLIKEKICIFNTYCILFQKSIRHYAVMTYKVNNIF